MSIHVLGRAEIANLRVRPRSAESPGLLRALGPTWLLASLLLAWGPTTPARGVVYYKIIEVPPPASGTWTEGRGMNNTTQVAGSWGPSPGSGNQRALVYEPSTGSHSGACMADCTPYGGSTFLCINDDGVVAGWTSSVCGGYGLALRSTVSDPMAFDTEGRLPGGGDSYVGAISPTGKMVGHSNRGIGCGGVFCQNACHACWFGAGAATALPDLGGYASTATAINATGMIAGLGALPGANGPYSTGAFVIEPGESVARALATLGGLYARAYAISSDGQVAGWSLDASGKTRATRWSSTGSPQDLGLLPGYAASAANAINDDGIAVGSAGPEPGWDLYAILMPRSSSTRAVLFADGTVRDLNDLVPLNSGCVLQEAVAINNQASILVNGTSSGRTRAFILVPCLSVRPDLDRDCDVDASDVTRFAMCWSGPAVQSAPGCAGDFDSDNDIDLSDFGILQHCFAGQDQPVDPDCDP